MNEFVLLYRGGMDRATASAQEMEANMGRWQTWLGKLGEEGKLKDVGVPLQRDVKRIAAGGVITDGPFAEGKELISGFSIIKAKDLAEAATIAKGCPIFDNGGNVEVRQVQPM